MTGYGITLILGMGGAEIVVVLFIVLMLFGAKSIPGVARGMGRGIRQLKDAANELQDEMRNSAEMDQDNSIRKDIEQPFRDIKEDIEKDD